MKIIDLLGNDEFKNKKVLEQLICYYMDFSKEKLFSQYESQIPSDIFDKIKTSYIEFEQDKKPLEYIFGYVEFFGIKFRVSKETIIPRPETEYMVKAVNEFLQQSKDTYILIDVGTGSGILGISSLFFNKNKFTDIYLTDVSETALEVAKHNYTEILKGHPAVKFTRSDLLGFLQDKSLQGEKVFIVANLPYIPDQLFEDNVEINVKKWEPKIAFLGGDDGLDLYKKMLDQIISLGLKNIVMFLEMMEFQVQELEKLYEKSFNFEVVETFHFNIKILKAVSKQP